MGKKLIAYFSATGTTAKAAKALAEASGADVFRIEPVNFYTDADLNWTDRNSRCIAEIKDKAFRPRITSRVENMADYDEIYLGFPIWGYREPRIIDTFLEQYDFDGKTIILFGTSGADGFGKTLSYVEEILKNANPSAQSTVKTSTVLVGYPTTEYINGHVVVGKLDETEVKNWVAGLGF